MSTAPISPPAGWYANPEGAGRRYWDGVRWTEHVNDQPALPQAPVFVRPESNGMAIGALVCGLCGVLVASALNILFFAGWAFGVVAIVLGLLALRKELGRTMAIWGVVLGVASFAIGVHGSSQVGQAVYQLNRAGQEFDAYSDCVNQAQTLDEMNSC